MSRTRRALSALLLLPVLVGLGACSGLSGTNEGGYIAGDGGVVEFAPDQREAPVELSGPTTTGEEFTLERGKTLRIAGCRIRIHGETRPCERMDEACEGLRSALSAPWGGGAYGEVLDDGKIAVGDSVVWE